MFQHEEVRLSHFDCDYFNGAAPKCLGRWCACCIEFCMFLYFCETGMKSKKTKTDGERIHIAGRNFFSSKIVRNSDVVSFGAAEAFALHVLYEHLANYQRAQAKDDS